MDSIFESLKINDNTFNRQIIRDKIEHIRDEQLQDFYGKLFDASHQYLNGIDRVAKVAETFKPTQQVDQDEIKAKELIELVQGMNGTIYKDHIRTGINFDTLLDDAKFPTVSDEDIAILNQVRPHFNLKLLIGNINGYDNGSEQLQAFKRAVGQSSKESLAIDNKIIKRLKR